jgi:hypothetical protein
MPRLSKNVIFGLNLLPGFWTWKNRTECPFSLDLRQIREAQKVVKANGPI